MDEIFRQVIISLRGMWRHRTLGLSIAWLVGGLGLVAIMLVPDKYEATARMFVNAESILKPLMAGMTVAPDLNSRIEVLSRVLVSRPNVQKLVRSQAGNKPGLSDDVVEKQVDALIKDLQIKGTGRDQVYTITLRDRDPERARSLVENFTRLFIESGQDNREADTTLAKKFIDQQIEAYEKKLEEAENRMKDFKRRYLGMSPGEGKDYFARMSEASAMLNKAQLELREAEQSRDALRRELANQGEDTTVYGVEPKADIDIQIETAKRSLSMLLQKYTDVHPDVTGMKRVIQELEAQKASHPAAAKRSAASYSATSQINVALAQAEANTASLRARVAEYATRENKLKESAMLMPQLEAEFAQLNRDYDINKKNYENLIVRRESVSMSGDMQTVSGVGDFKLIDPPRVSSGPVSPNRPLLLALALLFALAAGVTAAYGAAMVHPTYYDSRGLREATKMTVLGTVMKSDGGGMTPARRKRIFRFLSAVGGLVAVYGGVIGFSLYMLRPAQ